MSDVTYQDYELSADPTDIAAQAMTALSALIPGWKPAEGHLEVALIEVLARMDAETRDVAARVPGTIFTYFGRNLLNLPAIDASAASMSSTWTAVDDAGYTIPAGTSVAYASSGSDSVLFQTRDAVTIPKGSTQTANGEVVLVAQETGAIGNGVPAGPVTLIDSLVFIQSIQTTGTSSGGIDGETEDEYRDRLTAELELLTPRPILANDFAVMAKRIAGVDRAIAIDGYNADNNTYNNERTVTVALADAQGNAVGPSVRDAVAKYLDSEREVNFVVKTIDPSYTTINVAATVKKYATANSVAVQAAAEKALREYLSPEKWDWSPTVRFNELISLLDRVEGVSYVDALTQPTQNVVLPGVASLVRLGSVSISVLE